MTARQRQIRHAFWLTFGIVLAVLTGLGWVVL